METQTDSKQRSIVALVAIAIAMLILSSAIGAIIGQTFLSRGNTNIQAPLIATTQSSQNSIVFGSNNEDRVISGTVTAINGSSFVLHAQTSAVADASLIDRNVTVTGETRVTKTSQKDQASLSSEMVDFNKRMEAAKTRPQLVLSLDPFTHTNVDASVLAIGDFVTVTSAGNINTEKGFIASEVQFHSPVTTSIK